MSGKLEPSDESIDKFVDLETPTSERLEMMSLPSLVSEKTHNAPGDDSKSELALLDGPARISTTRTVFLTIAMLLTSFVGTASASAVSLLLPAMVRSLGGTQLEMQWVRINSLITVSTKS